MRSRSTPCSTFALLCISLALVACGGSDDSRSCSEAIDHLAGLSVARAGSSLEPDQRARHQRVLARAIDRELGPRCSDDNSALIECVLDATDPVSAKACWSKR